MLSNDECHRFRSRSCADYDGAIGESARTRLYSLRDAPTSYDHIGLYDRSVSLGPVLLPSPSETVIDVTVPGHGAFDQTIVIDPEVASSSSTELVLYTHAPPPKSRHEWRQGLFGLLRSSRRGRVVSTMLARLSQM